MTFEEGKKKFIAYARKKGWHWGKDEHAANGHLIADAPTLLAQRDDLLAACEAARGYICTILSVYNKIGRPIDAKEMWVHVRTVGLNLQAAIAAARGA